MIIIRTLIYYIVCHLLYVHTIINYKHMKGELHQLRLQGLPHRSDKSNSSILATLNVIKTTSLVILCTKHLHNSFCIHFDAFRCILMHSEHLEFFFVKNYLFFLSALPGCINMCQNVCRMNCANVLYMKLSKKRF